MCFDFFCPHKRGEKTDPPVTAMASKEPNKPKKPVKQIHFAVEANDEESSERIKEEDDLDFKMKQRRRSSVAKLVKDNRRESTTSRGSASGSSSEEDDEISPRNLKQQAHNGFNDFCVRNIEFARKGREEIKLVEKDMAGVMALRKMYEKDKPFQGARIVCCIHVNAQTAVVVETLTFLGAKVRWCSCNIYSTQNEVAAAVAMEGTSVFAWKGQSEEDFWWCIEKCLSDINWQPNLILDDGGDATNKLMKTYPSLFQKLKGIVEESMIGIHRLHQIMKNNKFVVPAMRIDDSVVKCKFDTVYNCRETVVDALKRCTDVAFAGLKVIVCGYGDVGKGCSSSLKALGCVVFVTEVDPICALQACMEGFSVVELGDVIGLVDCVITCTGNKQVICKKDFDLMRSGCIVCNMGHPFMEIDIKGLKSVSLTWQKVAPQVDHIIWPDGKYIVLLCEGRLATLGNCKIPSLVASVTATTQVLALMELFTSPTDFYDNDIFIFPKKMDELVAKLHLVKFQARLTTLSDEQSKYLGITKTGPFKVKTYRY